MIDKEAFDKAVSTLKSFTDKPVAEFDVSKPYAVLVKRDGPSLFKDDEETMLDFETFMYPGLHEQMGFGEAILEFFTYNYSVLFCEPGEKGSKYRGMDVMELVSELSGIIHMEQCAALFECYSKLFDEMRDYWPDSRNLNPEFLPYYPEEIGRKKFSVKVFNVEPENAFAIIKCLQELNFFKVAEDLKNNKGIDVSSSDDIRAVIDNFYNEMQGKLPRRYTGDLPDLCQCIVREELSYGSVYGIGFYNDFLNYYYTNLPLWEQNIVSEIKNFDEEYITELINHKRFPPKIESF